MHALQALVFARALGFCSRAPGLSHPSVPVPLRAALAFVLAFALAGTPGVLPPADAIGFLGSLVLEFAIGAAIGFGASVLYDGAYAGGRALDDYVGIRVMSPSAAIYLPSGYGRLYAIAFTGGFFVFGGYRVAIIALVHSFAAFPPGATLATTAWTHYAQALPQSVVQAAILAAGPAVAAGFAVQIAFGIVMRVVPRAGSMSLGFPLVFAAVLAVCAATIPVLSHLAAHPWLLAPESDR